ncbi:MAG: hypothetical protein IJ418_00700 [Clostridia bacterium]|nr:hypothetical protein [Clostridia bacterium]
MILDDGICTVFAVEDVSKPGEMPQKGYRKKSRAWYGVLDFATVASWPTEDREEVRVDERIRIPQNRSITNHDVVVLASVDEVKEGMRVLEVVRAYHGHDNDSGEMITDLSLEVVGA